MQNSNHTTPSNDFYSHPEDSQGKSSNSKKTSSIIQKLKRVPIIIYTYSVISVILLFGLASALTLSTQKQDARSQAAIENGPILYLVPEKVTVAPNGTSEFAITIDTRSSQVSAVDLRLTFDKSYLEVTSLESSTPFTTVLAPPKVDNSQGTATMVVGSAPTAPVVGKQKVGTLKVKAKTKTGTSKIEFKNTQVAALGYNENALQGATPAQVTVGTTNTPTPKPATPTPTAKPVVTPAPGNTTLNLGFKLQGVDKSGVKQTATVYVKDSTGKVTTINNVAVTSNNENVMRVDKPVALGNLATGKYDVFVKTKYSLIKKLGNITITKDTANTAPTNWNSLLVEVGDFNQQDEYHTNNINTLDLGRLLAIRTELTVEVTNANAQYDLNFDGIINTQDIGIILVNYTELNNRGDQL